MTTNEIKRLLRDEYSAAFAQAESFGQISDLEETYLEDCLTDLGDLLYTAQEKGTPVEKMLGADLESFCRSYFSEFTVRDRIKHICGTLFKDTWVVFALNLLLLTTGEPGHFDLWAIPTNWYTGWFLVFNFVFILFYNVLFSSVLRRVYFRIRHGEMIQTIGTIVLVLLSLFLNRIFQGAFSDIPAFLVVLLSGGYLLCYLLAAGISNYRRTGQWIDAEKRRRQRARREEKQSQRERAFVSQMTEIYFRKNEIRRQKGKTELSREHYTEQFQLENRRGHLYRVVLILVVLALFLVQGATWSWWNSLFAEFTIAVDLFAILFVWFMFFSPYVYRTRWIVEDKCRQKQRDLVTYAEWLRAGAQPADRE